MRGKEGRHYGKQIVRSVLRTGIVLMLGVLGLDISLLREYVQPGSGHHSAPLLEICLLKWPVKWQKSNVAIHPVLLGCFTLFFLMDDSYK